MGTKATEQHAWLHRLVGTWNVTSEMHLGPDEPPMTGTGTEKVTMLGDLWAYVEGEGTMPNGETMKYKSAIGYDVTFNEYRGCWFASVSSHLWKYHGSLSSDGNTLTLNCEGPHMQKDNATANYRDVIEFINETTRTLTSYGQDDDGNWHQFMRSTLTRV